MYSGPLWAIHSHCNQYRRTQKWNKVFYKIIFTHVVMSHVHIVYHLVYSISLFKNTAHDSKSISWPTNATKAIWKMVDYVPETSYLEAIVSLHTSSFHNILRILSFLGRMTTALLRFSKGSLPTRLKFRVHWVIMG